MSDSKYSKETTIEYAKKQQYDKECISSINTIVQRESFHNDKEKCSDYKDIDFNDAQAIDLDCVAKKKRQGNTICASVDMVVGLCNSKLLLIELKLNKKTPPNKISSDLNNKMDGSKKLLENDSNIENFVLISCNTEKTRSYINRIRKEETQQPKHCFIIISLKNFKNKYFP